MRIFASLALACGFIAPAMASNLACERKAAEIEQQMQLARDAGNEHRLRGLEKALSQNRTHCTDAALIADKRKDIAEQQEDVDELLDEIQEKQSEGRYDKVKKLERKLEREKAELDVLKSELKELERPR